MKTNSQIEQKQIFLHYQYLKNANLKLPSFNDTGFKVFSQNDEDGLLLYIFALIGISNRLCLDIAFCGPQGSNTANLICNWGFHGLLIEGSLEGVNKSKKFFSNHADTRIFPPTIVNSWVTKDNINQICEDNDFKGEIDLFSLDMDGIDYWIWKELTIADPKVVVVEYLDFLGPEKSLTIPYDEKFQAVHSECPNSGEPYDYFGASLSAFVNLGRSKGYRLVGVNKYCFNAFFVKENIALDFLPEITTQECFNHPKANFGINERWQRVKHLPWVNV
jgi:hypothetical protein